MEITDRIPSRDELVALYDSVDWRAYTADPDGLDRAVHASTWVRTAWDGERPIGLARALSDDVAIAYLQDLLVAPDAQRTGVGRALMDAFLERFAHVRMRALLTDLEERQRAFYESVGFTSDPRLRHFVRIGP